MIAFHPVEEFPQSRELSGLLVGSADWSVHWNLFGIATVESVPKRLLWFRDQNVPILIPASSWLRFPVTRAWVAQKASNSLVLFHLSKADLSKFAVARGLAVLPTWLKNVEKEFQHQCLTVSVISSDMNPFPLLLDSPFGRWYGSIS
jgi:hypothetical protein